MRKAALGAVIGGLPGMLIALVPLLFVRHRLAPTNDRLKSQPSWAGQDSWSFPPRHSSYAGREARPRFGHSVAVGEIIR